MPGPDRPDRGWEYVAEREAVAELFDALVDLDPDAVYTKSELAETAGVPMKTLYLNDTLDECADLGLLERAGGGDGSEAAYSLNEDSDLLGALAAFDDAYRNSRG